jgi:hypothetical protein
LDLSVTKVVKVDKVLKVLLDQLGLLHLEVQVDPVAKDLKVRRDLQVI